jgi:acyl dehydratase
MGEPVTEQLTEQSSAPLTLHGLEGLHERVGQSLGTSEWRTVTQEDISTFARLTGDEQWIHTDPERAAEGPFGATVQHGFLTLGLATGLLWSVVTVDGFNVILNYGLNKVRFPAPVPVGSKVRARVTLKECEEVAGGLQNVLAVTIEREGGDKPVCIAEWVTRQYGG